MTYRLIAEPVAFCVFVYVIVYNYVNVCTSHNNKPFTYLYRRRFNQCQTIFYNIQYNTKLYFTQIT